MEELNYLKIVMDGYINDNSRKYYKEYFIRQWKKAESNYYDLNEFFNGLRGVVQAFRDYIDHMNSKRVYELHMIIGQLEDKEKLSDQEKEALKCCKDELQGFRDGFDCYYASLGQITNNAYQGNLSPHAIAYMKESILLAFDAVSPPDDQNQDKPKKAFEDYFINNQIDLEGLKEYMAKRKGRDLAGAIYLLQESGFLPENLNVSGFLKSIDENINIGGVNKYLKRDEGDLTEIGYREDVLERVKKEIAIFL